MATARMAPELERLWLDIETERLRLRARYAGIDLDPRTGREARLRAVEWIREGSPVGDEAEYLEWLLERQARNEGRSALSAVC